MLMTSAAFGQIQKGDVRIGGNLSISKSENPGFEANRFSLNPNASFFISEQTSLGITLGFSNQKTNNGGTEQKTDQFAYGVFARFYKSMGDKFYVYLQPGITLADGDVNGTDFSSFSFNVTPGLAYFVSEKIALEMGLGGFFYTSQDVGGVDSDNYGFNINLTGFTLGASFFLRK